MTHSPHPEPEASPVDAIAPGTGAEPAAPDAPSSAPGVTEERRPPFSRRVLATLLAGAQGLALPVLVIAVALVVRLIYLEPIENDGDAINKWWMVKQFLHAGEVAKWNHHAARLAINAPTYVAQVLCGTRAEIYYVLPVTMGVAEALVAFALGARLGGAGVGVLAAVLVTAFPEVERSGSQLLPGGFCATFAGLAVYGVVRHAERSARGWLVFSGVALFLAYMSRITALYVLPGLAIATWLTRRRMMDVFWLLAPAAALFLTETAIYNLVSDFRFGQLSVMAATHGTKRTLAITAASVTERYRRADWYWQLALYALAATGPGLVALYRPRLTRIVVLASASYLLMVTFPTRGFTTARALGYHQRYFDDFLPLVMVIHASFAAGVVHQWLAGVVSGTAGAVVRALRRRVAWVAAAIVLGYGALSGLAGRERLGKGHPLRKLRADTALITDAYERGLPIVAPSSHVKALDVVRYVMLPDDLLLNDEGHLVPPKVRYVNAGGKRYAFVATPSGASRARDALATGRCFVQVERVANPHRARTTAIVSAKVGESCGK